MRRLKCSKATKAGCFVKAKDSGWIGEVLRINPKNPSSPIVVKWPNGEVSNTNSMVVDLIVIVKEAAIRLNGMVHSVPRPGRHHTIIDMLVLEKGFPPPIAGEQGFVLSDGKFVNRKKALKIALESGQLKLEDCHAPATGLFSEDLW